jgi:hypothetical protein
VGHSLFGTRLVAFLVLWAFGVVNAGQALAFVCDPLVSHVHSVFEDERMGIPWNPAARATDYFWSAEVFGSAEKEPAPILGDAFSRRLPGGGKKPSRLLPWIGSNNWWERDDPGGGGGTPPSCEEELSGFGNLRDYPVSLEGWIDPEADDGQAPVITNVSPPTNSEVNSANLAVTAEIADASTIAVQVFVDDFFVLHQGNDRYNAETGQFALSIPITYTLCFDVESAYPDQSYVPMGDRDVKIKVTDKGGRTAQFSVRYDVGNTTVSGWLTEVDETLAAIRSESGHSDGELVLAEAFAAMNRAYLSVGSETKESYAQKAGAFADAIRNWDGIWLGELRLDEAQREQIAANYSDLASQVLALTADGWRRYQLASGGMAFRSAAQSFRKWWRAHQCEIAAVKCTIGFLAILGGFTAAAISTGGTAMLAVGFLGSNFYQGGRCLFALWENECF